MLSHMLRASSIMPFFVASSQTQTSGTATSLSISKPTGAAAGDLLVAVVMAAGASITWTGSGWTERLDANSRAIYTRVLAGSEGSSFTFTSSGSAVLQGYILLYRNADFGVIGAISTNQQNPVAPSITTTKPNSLVLCVASYILEQGTFTLSDWTSVASDTTTAPTSNIFSKLFPTQGATGDVTVTSSTVQARAVLLSLIPKK